MTLRPVARGALLDVAVDQLACLPALRALGAQEVAGREVLDLGSGRIVASGIDAPILLLNLV
jgi:hypothetical protein